MQRFDLVLKKICGTQPSAHVVVNKDFLTTAAAAAQPIYIKRFVMVGEGRMVACLRVFISITTMVL